jgi:TolC family type I secretion outer membrane protein
LRTGLLSSLAAAALAAGCATVRQAREVQDGAKVPPGERTLRAAEVGLGSNSVLTLDEALRIALAYHPSVAQATQAVAAAAAQVTQANAAYWPSVDAGASYGQRTSNSQGTKESSDTSESYSGSIGLDALIYDFGKTPAAVRQARARRVAAECSLRAARNDVAYGVRTAYLDLGKAQELLQVAEQAVRQYSAHLEQVKAFADAGRRIRYDVTKAEVDLGNAQLNLIKARNDLTTARATLNRSLGLAEEPGYRISAPPSDELAGKTDELMAVARRQHPEILALKAQEAVASAAVDAAIADLYPELRLRADYGLSGSAFPLVWNWSATLQSALQIFNGARNTATIEAATAELRAARARLADREQQIHLDLTRAVSQLESTRQGMTLTTLIVRQARESLDLIDERYKLGKASAVEVTDAQVALTSAQAEQVKARFEHQTAIAQIQHAIGENQP